GGASTARRRTVEQGSGDFARSGALDRRNASIESDAEAQSAQHRGKRVVRRPQGDHRMKETLLQTAEDTLVCVQREWNGWQTAEVRLSEIGRASGRGRG